MSAAVSQPTTLLDLPMQSALPVEHLFDFVIHFDPVQVMRTPRGTRMTYVVRGGEILGPRVRARFLRGGGDWITIGADRIAHLDVRATAETDDGDLIFVTNTGRAPITDGISKRLFAGEFIAWTEMFARSAPLFETGADRYAWLNGTVTVAVNEFSLRQVNYRVYALREEP
jgi:hypothetical protein